MNFENIPESLKALDQWVCWGKPGKPPKIPYNPVTGYPAKAGQPETWTSFSKAVEAVKAGKYKGVGFELNNNGIVGIDLDNVVDPKTGYIVPEAKNIVTDLDSYTETSQSGKGLHVLVKADLELTENRSKLQDCNILGEKWPGIEIYNKERYLIITGDRYGENKGIEERNAITKATVDYYFRPQGTTEYTGIQRNTTVGAMDTAGIPMVSTTAPADQLKIGLEKDSKLKALWNGDRPNGNESADDQGLMNKLAYWCSCNPAAMREAFLNSPHTSSKDPEHQKKLNRKDYLKRTIETAIKSCKSTAAEDHNNYQMDQVRKDFSPVEQSASPALVKASDIPYEPPRWLIAPYFQRGKGTLIQADPGTGKTAFMCAIAAHVSTGRPILDIRIERPGNVLILSVEDDLPVLRGRIEANGGDLDKCIFMTNAAGITFTSPEIEQAIKDVNAKLIIFDPFQAFLGKGVDMFRSNETRPELAKLFETADRNDCSVGIIGHTGKGSMDKSPVNRALGSVDIPAAMRSIIQIVRNPDDENECIAVHVKCSNAPKGRSISYRIGDRGGIEWTGYSPLTVEDLNTITKRKEKGIPYENEPLVQVFNQLIADRPGGGFWSYEEVKAEGMKILGFPPFSSTNDLKAKLNGPLTRELQEHDGLIVTCGHKSNGARGIRIEQYQHPQGYQTKIATE